MELTKENRLRIYKEMISIYNQKSLSRCVISNYGFCKVLDIALANLQTNWKEWVYISELDELEEYKPYKQDICLFWFNTWYGGMIKRKRILKKIIKQIENGN